jgi:hypothetical protein
VIPDLITIGKVLGIPGVVILCWYLLEVRKGEREKATQAAEAERQRANDKRNAVLERMRIDAENRRTAALEVGFRSIGVQLGEHGERLAGIESTLQINKRRNTPATGTSVIEVGPRFKSNGGDR